MQPDGGIWSRLMVPKWKSITTLELAGSIGLHVHNESTGWSP
ncbi:hypothetical protein HanXRQr2_Chr17g0785771 [Helianthus annuus]|uniref:Uncharacterized protein n=1 Tax=Helianthus annuus TaxID=4232 RepID=A0A9K3GT79_HELAN|nr:hypothetical protein HanXRQr2_Chr17g0785771 [Helianthus annuus]